MKSRRGFALVAGLFFLVIVLLLAGTRMFFSRQHMHLVARQAEYERAWHMARSTLTVGQLHVDGFIRWLNDPGVETPRRNHPPAEYQHLATSLLDDNDQLLSVRTDIPLELDVIKDWTSGVPGFSSLILTLRLDPVVTDKDSGNPAGYRILLLAEATIGSTSARCALFNECRQVSLLPPVVGKFVLLVDQTADLEPNRLLDARDSKNVKGEPLIVSPARKAWTAPVEPDLMSSQLDEGGWIWLGGEKILDLRLAEAGGRADRRSPFLEEDSSIYELPDKGGLNSRGDLAFFARRQRFCRELGSMATGEPLALKNPREFAYSSLLQPAGSDAAPSPGLVIGHVSRSWVLVQGIHNLARDIQAPLPWLSPGSFTGPQWPGQMSTAATQRLREYFASDFNAYSQRMSTIISEPWNSALVCAVDFGIPPETQPLIQDMSTLPPGTPAPDRMKRLKIDGSGAAWWEIVPPRSIEMTTDKGKLLYQGNSPLEACRKEQLLPLATHHYQGIKELLSARKNSTGYALGSVIHLAGDLRVDSPVTFTDGGILLVDGNITLEAPLTVPDNAPLTLISLSGNVTIQLLRPVRISLLAPAGILQPGDSCQISGTLAARRFTLNRGTTGKTRQLTWDPLLDPTDTANRIRQQRVVFSGGWRLAAY